MIQDGLSHMSGISAEVTRKAKLTGPLSTSWSVLLNGLFSLKISQQNSLASFTFRLGSKMATV